MRIVKYLGSDAFALNILRTIAIVGVVWIGHEVYSLL